MSGLLQMGGYETDSGGFRGWDRQWDIYLIRKLWVVYNRPMLYWKGKVNLGTVAYPVRVNH